MKIRFDDTYEGDDISVGVYFDSHFHDIQIFLFKWVLIIEKEKKKKGE